MLPILYISGLTFDEIVVVMLPFSPILPFDAESSCRVTIQLGKLLHKNSNLHFIMLDKLFWVCSCCTQFSVEPTHVYLSAIKIIKWELHILLQWSTILVMLLQWSTILVMLLAVAAISGSLRIAYFGFVFSLHLPAYDDVSCHRWLCSIHLISLKVCTNIYGIPCIFWQKLFQTKITNAFFQQMIN